MRYWTEEEIKELREKYFYYLEHKEEAEKYFKRNIQQLKIKASTLGITSMKLNKKCSMFLGCHIAERILSYVFKDVERMPIHTKGYDFICNKGMKIDVKSCCLFFSTPIYSDYRFKIKHNKIADYFLLIGFDNRDDLNPQHIWLIRGNEIIIRYRKLNDIENFVIVNTLHDLTKYSKYELTDKVKEIIDCCSQLKI